MAPISTSLILSELPRSLLELVLDFAPDEFGTLSHLNKQTYTTTRHIITSSNVLKLPNIRLIVDQDPVFKELTIFDQIKRVHWIACRSLNNDDEINLLDIKNLHACFTELNSRLNICDILKVALRLGITGLAKNIYKSFHRNLNLAESELIQIALDKKSELFGDLSSRMDCGGIMMLIRRNYKDHPEKMTSLLEKRRFFDVNSLLEFAAREGFPELIRKILKGPNEYTNGFCRFNMTWKKWAPPVEGPPREDYDSNGYGVQSAIRESINSDHLECLQELLKANPPQKTLTYAKNWICFLLIKAQYDQRFPNDHDRYINFGHPPQFSYTIQPQGYFPEYNDGRDEERMQLFRQLPEPFKSLGCDVGHGISTVPVPTLEKMKELLEEALQKFAQDDDKKGDFDQDFSLPRTDNAAQAQRFVQRLNRQQNRPELIVPTIVACLIIIFGIWLEFYRTSPK